MYSFIGTWHTARSLSFWSPSLGWAYTLDLPTIILGVQDGQLLYQCYFVWSSPLKTLFFTTYLESAMKEESSGIRHLHGWQYSVEFCTLLRCQIYRKTQTRIIQVAGWWFRAFSSFWSSVYHRFVIISMKYLSAFTGLVSSQQWWASSTTKLS